MKVGAWFFAGGAPFFAAFGIAYGLVTHWHEPVGIVCLFLATGLALLIGTYLAYTASHIDPGPDDDAYGEIAQGAGELGEFAPYSWWPLAAAGGGAIIFLGLAIGWWMCGVGALVGALGVTGWVYEFYRGEHAH